MDPIYAQAINSFSNDLDNLWKDKNAFSSVKSSDAVSIEDGNSCSYKRFMLSTSRGAEDNMSVSSRNSSHGKRGWGSTGNQSITLIDRLAKTAAIWTIPDLSRIDADKILHCFEPGIFIVRMTTDKKTMVLSYRMEDKAQHVMIKVDLKKGFFMDGSKHVFRNVNHMIAHYMKHPIQTPDLSLKLPRALIEAHEAAHFQFFENMKINFWTTLLASKSIDDIWSKPVLMKEQVEDTKQEIYPPLPPRGYHLNELNIIQGLAEDNEIDSEYQEIQKAHRKKHAPPPPPLSPPTFSTKPQTQNSARPSNLALPLLPTERFGVDKLSVPTLPFQQTSTPTVPRFSSPPPSLSLFQTQTPSALKSLPSIPLQTPSKVKPSTPVSPVLPAPLMSFFSNENETKPNPDEEGHYSMIWNYGSGDIPKERDNKSQVAVEPNLKKNIPNLHLRIPQPPSGFQSDFVNSPSSQIRKSSDSPVEQPCFTIPKIIERYYPQLLYPDIQSQPSTPYISLKDDILQKNDYILENSSKPEKKEVQQNIVKVDEPIYQSQYETPWDIKNAWINKLMSLDNKDIEGQHTVINEFLQTNSNENLTSLHSSHSMPKFSKSEMDFPSIDNNINLNSKVSRCSTETDDSEEELTEEENRLQIEFLTEIEAVLFSQSPSSEIYSSYKYQYGLSIRRFLTKLCSRRGNSEISNSIRLFVSCTVSRNDLSPYTTMRLIRQYMSGLKNLITKNKSEFSLNSVIEEEIKNTPKHVFINLDSIIESVLSKSVLKPLKIHVYKLLILEHYKNNNLKQIADGVETSKIISLEKLGLKKEFKSIIDSKIELIRKKFQLISKQYSPEKKITYMISIVDIVFNLLKEIYGGTEVESSQFEIKSENILPIFVYIFSQCKLYAMSTQCEVEYVEGLIWSSKLVNGEPGFFLLNLMSALEAIKVLARPKFESRDMIDLSESGVVRVDNSAFYSKINPCSLSDAATGSVNVIILDEKINRLVTKTFPVRSTVTVSSLCNTIAHRLGIFNPKDYRLYTYTGFDESLLKDHECPLLIKQAHQQQTGENINFLFKRNNANFLIPCDISAR